MSYKMHILVCGGTGCRASASKNIICRLEDCLKERALEDEVQVIATGCFGFCEKGPIVKIMPDNTFYVQVKPEDAEEIVNEHIIKGRKVERLLYKEPSKKVTVSDSKHMEFYKKQKFSIRKLSLGVCSVLSIRKTSKNVSVVTVTAL